MSKHLKPALLSVLPSFILGNGFSFLISILGGMEKVKETTSIPMFIGFIIFMLLFVLRSNGQNIFGRFLKYAAYECWLSPLCILIYSAASVSQAKTHLGAAGATGASIGGAAMIIVFAVVGGLLGVVLYLIGRAVSKSYVENPHAFNETNNAETFQKVSAIFSKNNMANLLKCIGCAIAVLIFFVIVFHISDKKNENIAESSNNEVKKGYTLSAKEQTLLNFILQELAKTVSDAQNNIFTNDLVITSAGQVAQAYKQNQVSADQQYYKKWMIISAQIQNINSGIGNEPYLTLYGPNYFLSPQAYFKDGNTQKIANLSQNQTVSLVCQCTGAVIGVPVFKKCEFSSDYAAGLIPAIQTKVINFLKGDETQIDVIKLTVGAIAMARILPDQSPCFDNVEDKCAIDIHNLVKTKKNKEMLYNKEDEVVHELELTGIDMQAYPLFKPNQKTDTTTLDCPHKHKQQVVVHMSSVSQNGVETEVPQDMACEEVCDSFENQVYIPCDS